MKKTFPIILLLFIGLVACDEESQNQIANIKTVTDRIEDLNKSIDEIKSMEDAAALMKEDEYLLEYEYPIREHESYVVTYRFRNNKCFEIKLDTYLDKEAYATKIQKEVMTDIANNKSFGKTKVNNDVYHWESEEVKIQLNTQNNERGAISLNIILKH